MDSNVPKAIKAGDAEAVRSSIRNLLDRGTIDVHARSKQGATYLINASYLGDVELVELLLQAGSEVDARAHDGCSALFLAVQGGNIGLARALIQAGADVNIVCSGTYTALYTAAERGHADIVDLLLAAGAAKTVNHCVPITLESETTTVSPLMTASKPGKDNVRMVKAFIKAGADVTYKNSAGVTALSAAVSGGNVAVAKALLSAGALVNLEEAQHTFVAAIMSAHVEMIHALVGGGADVDMRVDGGVGETALLFICACPEARYVAVVKALISLGAAVDAKNDLDMTPLMAACSRGSDDQVKLLLEAGADVTLKDDCGRDALGYALHNHRTEAARLVVKALRSGSGESSGAGAAATAGGDGGASLNLIGLSISDTDEDAVMKLKKVKECMNCGKKGEQIKMCSGCKRVALCSAECLKAVWPTHKAACRKWSKENKQREKAGGEHGGREGGKKEANQAGAKDVSICDGKHAADHEGGKEEKKGKYEDNHGDSK